MAKDVILLGEVAERGATTIEVRCSRCARHGRLSVARLLAMHGPDAPVGDVMDALAGDCPNQEAHNIAERCSVFCPDLARLFSPPPIA